jgi:hypothetical protein
MGSKSLLVGKTAQTVRSSLFSFNSSAAARDTQGTLSVAPPRKLVRQQAWAAAIEDKNVPVSLERVRIAPSIPSRSTFQLSESVTFYATSAHTRNAVRVAGTSAVQYSKRSDHVAPSETASTSGVDYFATDKRPIVLFDGEPEASPFATQVFANESSCRGFISSVVTW